MDNQALSLAGWVASPFDRGLRRMWMFVERAQQEQKRRFWRPGWTAQGCCWLRIRPESGARKPAGVVSLIPQKSVRRPSHPIVPASPHDRDVLCGATAFHPRRPAAWRESSIAWRNINRVCRPSPVMPASSVAVVQQDHAVVSRHLRMPRAVQPLRIPKPPIPSDIGVLGLPLQWHDVGAHWLRCWLVVADDFYSCRQDARP